MQCFERPTEKQLSSPPAQQRITWRSDRFVFRSAWEESIGKSLRACLRILKSGHSHELEMIRLVMLDLTVACKYIGHLLVVFVFPVSSRECTTVWTNGGDVAHISWDDASSLFEVVSSETRITSSVLDGNLCDGPGDSSGVMSTLVRP